MQWYLITSYPVSVSTDNTDCAVSRASVGGTPDGRHRSKVIERCRDRPLAGDCGALTADSSASCIYEGSSGVTVYLLDQTTGIPQSVTGAALPGMVVSSLARDPLTEDSVKPCHRGQGTSLRSDGVERSSMCRNAGAILSI